MMKKPDPKERGQASIVIGMFILTFLLFFAFVVNTGMLVNAKINLQNAADLAAYSGAAVQARQMTTLSFINYEMRRQYKKFLFRYYILGTMFQDSFPGKKGASFTAGARSYVPGPLNTQPGASPGPPYPFPAVCVDLYSAPTGASNNGSNGQQVGGQEAYCRIVQLPHIAGSGSTSITGDAIQSTLDQELNQIEAVREAACDNLSALNQALLFFWLFNTVPEGPVITSVSGTSGNNFNATSLQIMYDRVKYLSSGLGLVPRELLLAFRAGVMQSWINLPANTGVQGTQVDGWRSGTSAMKYERTINAYKSAYDTLGDTTWDASTIRMDELVPNGTGAPLSNPPSMNPVNLLELTMIPVDFTAFSVGYEQGPPQGSPPSYDCYQKLYPIPVHNLPVGFSKTQNFTTYYAVRVTANAKVLFSPWQAPLTLSAYSAAMPFGSRIGPDLHSDDFTYTADTEFLIAGASYKPSDPYFSFKDLPGFIPNLAIQKSSGSGQTDSSGVGGGWNNTLIQNAYYQWVPEYGNRQEYDALMNLAMVPNPWEESQYDIPNDLAPTGDPFVQWFDTNGGAAFWAPLIDGTPGQFPTLLSDAMNNFFSTTGSIGIGKGVSGQVTPPDLQAMLIAAISEYATRLQSHSPPTEGLNNADQPPPGAVTEGIYIMPMADPFQVPPGVYNTVTGNASEAPVTLGSLSPPIAIKPTGIQGILPSSGVPSVDATIFMVDQNTRSAAVRDSWNGVQDSNFVPAGRVGYSVEFVSFDSLKKFPNQPPTSDPDFQAVMASGALKH